jgi:NAD(P)-dependent dehydrogenase (short-subunit alcohol dehydrogenase family)
LIVTTLIGKVALVTGGTSGIGKATAIAFAKNGAKVVIAGRRQLEGEAVVHEIQTNGGEAIFFKGEQRDERQVETLVDKAIATYGRLDIAFNNAGIEGEYAQQGIRVNAISPGGVETEMLQRSTGTPEEESAGRTFFRNLHPVGRFATPEEIAATVVFLASSGAAFVTGANLLADGGWSVQ